MIKPEKSWFLLKKYKEKILAYLLALGQIFLIVIWLPKGSPPPREWKTDIVKENILLKNKETISPDLENLKSLSRYWKPGQRDPFRSPPSPPPPPPPPPPPQGNNRAATPSNGTAPISPRQITLSFKGVIKGKEGDPVAMLEDKKSGRIYFKRKGERIDGMVILDFNNNWLNLKRGVKKIRLEIGE